MVFIAQGNGIYTCHGKLSCVRGMMESSALVSNHKR